MKSKKPKIIVIVGPTASGKSALAVKIAKAFGGEIISADSRQVYRGLDIGSGKITKKEMWGIPHHLIDVYSPKKVFTVANFQKIGQEKIKDIISRNKVPIICGGSYFYVSALIDSTTFPDVPPNLSLRAKLGKKSVHELIEILMKLDPKRLRSIDKNNPVRLIRAIEIAKALGKVPRPGHKKSHYKTLIIGTKVSDEILREKIKTRLIKRIRSGMLKEVQDLHEKGLSWKRLESFGLEYRSVAEFLQGKIDKPTMIKNLETNIWQFAKKQNSWFKRDKRIVWFQPDRSDLAKITVTKFIND